MIGQFVSQGMETRERPFGDRGLGVTGLDREVGEDTAHEVTILMREPAADPLDEKLDPLEGAVLFLERAPHDALANVGKHLGLGFFEQELLGREVIGEVTLGDACPRGDLLDAGRAVALRAKQVDRLGEDQLAGLSNQGGHELPRYLGQSY